MGRKGKSGRKEEEGEERRGKIGRGTFLQKNTEKQNVRRK